MCVVDVAADFGTHFVTDFVTHVVDFVADFVMDFSCGFCRISVAHIVTNLVVYFLPRHRVLRNLLRITTHAVCLKYNFNLKAQIVTVCVGVVCSGVEIHTQARCKSRNNNQQTS